MPFIYHEHFLIDLQNKTAFKRNLGYAQMFKVKRSDENDRTRSRLTNRKSFDSAAVYQAKKDSFFAKDIGEYATMWFSKNGKKEPTGREIIAGVWKYYTLKMHNSADALERASF